MHTSELIDDVFTKNDLLHKDTKVVVYGVLDTIIQTLAKGENIRLDGVGTFVVKEKAAYTGRNPSTGESLDIPAKMVVSFKPFPSLKQIIQKKVSRFRRK